MSETRRQATTTPAAPVGQFFEDAVSKTRFWWLLLITGVAWIVLSIVILRFDYTTVAAVAVLFGVYCLVAAVNQIVIGAVSSSTGWRIAHGLLGLATGSGYLDLGIFLHGVLDLPFVTRVLMNLPHIAIGGFAAFAGFVLARSWAPARRP